LLRAVLPMDADDDPGARLEEQLVERFHSMACRSAVMSGDRLNDAEIESLLREAAALEHPHNCPHGRPTVLTFPGAELERYFRRRC
jgi:DNA mismatch repair protein MutL